MSDNANIPQKTSSILSLNAITLPVCLGVSEEERQNNQNVRIDIQIYMDTPIDACTTDDIVDTFCYDEMLQIVENTCQSQEFHLIEHLCYKIHISVKKVVHNHGVRIKVQKTYPPLAHKLESASFEYSDVPL